MPALVSKRESLGIVAALFDMESFGQSCEDARDMDQ